jgi:hypothetical protein
MGYGSPTEETTMNKMDIKDYFEVFNSNAKKLSSDMQIDYQKLRRRIKKPDIAIQVDLDEQFRPCKLYFEYREEIERA